MGTLHARIKSTRTVLPERLLAMNKKRLVDQLFTAIVVSALAVTLHQPAATAATRVTDNTVQLPSGKVFYRDSGGKGIPVVFLHAGSGNSMMWEYQIPAFTNAGYRFIAIDYRGAGNTAGGPSSNSTAIISELTTRLGLPKFHLLGTAAGGGAALQYALTNRDKLRSIIVANSIGNVMDKEYSDMGNRIRPAGFNQLPLDLKELGPSYRASNPEGVKRWLELAGEDRTAAPPPGPDALGAPARGMGGGPPPGDAPGGNNPYAVTWANLEKLTIPTLLITGDADLYTPPSVLRMFADHMKHAETAIIAESGHSAYWENPDAFNRTVLAFMSKH